MAQNAPQNRRSGSCGQAGLKMLLCAMAMLLGVSVGWSQPAPDTILLPDSLGPLRPGYHLAFGSSTDNIYVASESSDILVVDGETFQRVKRINTGPVGGALLVAGHNRLYCSHPSQGRIGVIDCSTNNVVGSILVGTRPKLLCYSSASDKLYCGDTIDRTVSVIDCAANALLKVIPVGRGLTALAYDPTSNKVYAGTRDAVLAISCSTDSIVTTISSVREARGLCLNKRRQKLYAVVPPYIGLDTVFVIGTQTDSVVARMDGMGLIEEPVLACNEITERLYGVNYLGDILEFDCVRDTLLRFSSVGGQSAVGLVCDSVRNRLYYLCEIDAGGYLFVLDCATLDVISWTYVGLYPDVLQADPARYRMMCAGGSSEAAALTVLDYKGDSSYPRGAVPLSGWTHVMCHNPVAGKLYYWWGLGVGGVGVIDEQTNRLVAQVFLSQVSLGDLTYSRTSNKLYFVALQKGLAVMDGSRDSIIKVIDFSGWVLHPTWCPDENKVYCYARAGARRYIAVVDCYTDSVVREIDVYETVRRFEYLGEGRMLCTRFGGLTLIDTRADTVLVDSATEASLYRAVAHTGDGEKVYIALNGRLEVRSSSTLSLLATIDWPYGGPIGGGGFLVYSDTTHKLYWFSDYGDSVLAINATSDTVVARMPTRAWIHRVYLDHTGRYLFCFTDSVRVYDTQSDSLVAVCPMPFPSLSVTPNPDRGCFYVGCRDVILVYSDVPPGVEEAMTDERGMMNREASVVRGVLYVPGCASSSPSTSCLLDVSGRKVMTLQSGANDVRALAPGIYFVREAEAQAQAPAQAIKKIVVAR